MHSYTIRQIRLTLPQLVDSLALAEPIHIEDLPRFDIKDGCMIVHGLLPRLKAHT